MNETEQNRIFIIALEDDMTNDVSSRVKAELLKYPGVVSAENLGRNWNISCYEGTASRGALEDVFTSLGLRLKGREPRKGFVSRWLASLAESNQKRFGSERPDCCSMNKKA
jgi:hypothetical protein